MKKLGQQLDRYHQFRSIPSFSRSIRIIARPGT
jgi:hypothetical protein